MNGRLVDSKITVTMDVEEAKLLEDLLGQFTYYTTMTILRDGDYPDALDGKDSETGFEPGGFDKEFDKAVDDLLATLTNLLTDDLS